MLAVIHMTVFTTVTTCSLEFQVQVQFHGAFFFFLQRETLLCVPLIYTLTGCCFHMP